MKQLFFKLTTIFFWGVLNGASLAQTTSVFNPDDPVVRCPCNTLPAQPPHGQVGKWVASRVVSWSTDDFKAYIYKGMAFRLKFPRNFKTDPAAIRYPMVVFLHGLGEAGPITDNERQFLTGAAQRHQAHINNGEFNGFALFPQNTQGWFQDVGIIAELIDILVDQVRVDPFRVTVHGLSAGGAAVWDIITSHPRHFAAALPMSSVKGNPTEFRFSPVWHFQGALDNNPKLSDAQQLEAAMKAIQANYQLTVYRDLGHSVWARAYSEPDFVPFLNRANKTNPHVIAGKRDFCGGEPVSATLGVTPGFNGYEWRRNGQVIAGATGNTITVTEEGTYDVRIRRGTEWSYFSPIPVVISRRPPTAGATITVENSTVLPDGAGRTTATLSAPEGYARYLWSNGATTRSIEVASGTYTVQVTEEGGCISFMSAPVTIRMGNTAGAPLAPTGFAATTLNESSVRLNWNDAADNETAYELYASTAPHAGFRLIAALPANSTAYTHTGLEENTAYYYRLRAINSNGSHPVVTTQALTAPDRQSPSIPQNLRVVAKSRSFALLQWDSATDNMGISAYEIFRDGQLIGVSAGTTFRADNLTAFQTYRFQVRARDAAGNQSPFSASLAVAAVAEGLVWHYYEKELNVLAEMEGLVPMKIGMSPGFDLSPRTVADGFAFRFEGFIHIPTAGTYTFFTRSDDGSDLWIGNTRVVDNDLIQNMTERSGTITLASGTYPITVRYRQVNNNFGLEVRWQGPGIAKQLIPESALRDNFTPTGIPTAPSQLRALVKGHSRILLTWNDNSTNETGFEVFRSQHPEENFIYVGTAPANATSYTDAGLQPSTTYYYRLRAVSDVGHSAFEPVGLQWAYYEGNFANLTQLASATPVLTGTAVNFSLSPRRRNTNFAFVWTGFLQVPAAGTYTFFTRSDDGSDLWIGNTRVVNNDFNQSMTERSGTFTFPAAGTYPLTVRYRQVTNNFGLEVRWQGPSVSKQLIPDANLNNRQNRATTLPAPLTGPIAPEGLHARAVTPVSIELAWLDKSSDEEFFRIFRSSDSVHFALIGQVAAADGGEVHYNDTNLNGNTRYFYRITAVNVAGESTPAAGRFTTGNRPPVIEPLPNHTARTGQAYTVYLRASDPDGNTVSFSGINLPAFASIENTGNGRARLNISAANQAGNYNIGVRATDNAGAQSEAFFSLTISNNRLPVLTVAPASTLTMNEGQVHELTLSATDEDGDVPAIGAVDLPPFAVLIPQTAGRATLRLSARFSDQGTHIFQLTATDAAGAQVSQIVSVTVRDVNPNFRVLINFNSGNDPQGIAPAPWNNTGREPVTGMSIGNLLTDSGQQSGIGLQFPTPWGGAFNAGASGTGIVPNSVLREYYWFGIFHAPNTTMLKVTGLPKNLPLTFRFLASSVFRNGGVTNNGSTVFTIGERSVTVRAESNTGTFGILENILADQNGEVTIQLAKAADNPVPSAGYLNALIVESHYEESLPDAPSDLRLAVQMQTSSVLIRWQDNARNENGYEIWRAATAAGPFTLIHTTAADATSFNDSTAYGTSYWFYKVRSVNASGASAFTKTVSIATPNFAPRFDNVKDFRLRAAETLTYEFIVFDNPSDNVQITIANLPPFVTFTDLGNGRARLSVNPSRTHIGTYRNIRLTATDNKGLTATARFEIVVTDNNITTYYVNLNAVNPAPAPWNNFNGQPTPGASLLNLKDEYGQQSNIDLVFQNGWGGANNGREEQYLGVCFGDNSMELPDAVMQTYFFDFAWEGNKTVWLNELNPAKRYNLALMCSWNTGGNNTTAITINGVTRSVQASGNYTDFIRFYDLQPDAAGRIGMTFSRTGFGIWNALIIEEFNAASAPPNVPSKLTAQTAGLTSIRLQWVNRGGNPASFEIYRSGSASAGYSLIASLPATATSYTDNGLTSNRRYYYRIRAVNAVGASDFTAVASAITAGQVVHINFNASNQHNAAAPWYNTNTSPAGGMLGRALLSNIRNSAGTPSGINIHLDAYFDGSNPFGTNTGNNSGVVPDNVMRTFYFTEIRTEGRLRLSGLDNNLHYNLIFYAGTTFQEFNGNTIYTVHGNRYAALNPQNNTANVARIDGVSPVYNQIPIAVKGAPRIQYGYINALTVQVCNPNAPDASSSARVEAQENPPDNRTPATSTEREAETQGAVFPNPFEQMLNIRLNIEQAQEVNFMLIDAAGCILMRDKRYVNAGLQVVQLDTTDLHLTTGTYFLKITAPAEGKSQTVKVLRY